MNTKVAYDRKRGILHIIYLELRLGKTILRLVSLRESDLQKIHKITLGTEKCQNPSVCWKNDNELFIAWENYHEDGYILEGRVLEGDTHRFHPLRFQISPQRDRVPPSRHRVYRWWL